MFSPSYSDYWEEIKRTGALISALSLKYNTSISPVRVREAEWTQGDTPFLSNVRRECVPV